MAGVHVHRRHGSNGSDRVKARQNARAIVVLGLALALLWVLSLPGAPLELDSGARKDTNPAPSESDPLAGMRDDAEREALLLAVTTQPCVSPLTLYRNPLVGWTVGHSDGRPPRIQLLRVGPRFARMVGERADAIAARSGARQVSLAEALGCER